jgi:hypothetical protein
MARSMRAARLVGLSPDGTSLIVVTDSGEHLAIRADERLRAAVYGDRPRLGQLEIEMESALSPREIQSRIRAGGSVEDVARTAGIPVDRVERFATPVLAEREYIAGQASAASVRRRGETSGHRNLRGAIVERLSTRGVDLDALRWDSYRMEDGRWGVTADYRSGESDRRALFLYDVRGRFSVAGNDDARWILGEQSPARGPQPGRRRPAGSDAGDSLGGDQDAEPTLDLSDELAIVRAVQEPPPAPPEARTETPRLARVQELRPVRAPEPGVAAGENEAAEPAPRDEPVEGRPEAGNPAAPGEPDVRHRALDAGKPEEQPATSDASTAPGPAIAAHAAASDASAVPAAAAEQGGGWEPAIVVNYPVEPSQVERAEEHGDELSLMEHPPAAPRHRAPAPAPEEEEPAEDGSKGTDRPGPPDTPVQIEDREDEADALEEEQEPAEDEQSREPTRGIEVQEQESAPAAAESAEKPKPARTRKRAAVPSWDEIMFGSPKQRP